MERTDDEMGRKKIFFFFSNSKESSKYDLDLLHSYSTRFFSDMSFTPQVTNECQKAVIMEDKNGGSK